MPSWASPRSTAPKQAMAALKKMADPARAGAPRRAYPGDHRPQLVPGDVILLEAGNAVPADCRLVESANLRIQEAC